MIYKNAEKITMFKGDYSPLSIYKGNTQVSGWQYSQITGKILVASNTYNDTARLVIDGKTNETGTGTKSPDNPYILDSVNDFELISCCENLFDLDNWYNFLRSFTTTNVYKTTADGIDCIKYHPYLTYNKEYMLGCFKPETQYTLSYSARQESIGSGTITGIRFKHTDGTYAFLYIPNDTSWHNLTITSAAGKTVSSIQMLYNFAGFVYIDENSVMLVEGSVSKPYKKYKGSRITYFNTLHSLPNGAKDYIVIDNTAKTAKLYKHCESTTLSAGTEWIITEAKNNSSIMSSQINKTALIGKSLTSDIAITTAHTLIYELEMPTVINLMYDDVPTYYPHTQIYTAAKIKPVLEGTIRRII